MMKFWLKLGLAMVAIGAVIYGGLWYFAGGFVLNYLHGNKTWPEMRTTDIRLSRSMHLALQDKVPAVHAGAYTWRTLKPGFDIAELPVLSDRGEVDRIDLVRIDPKLYTFSVHNQAAVKWTIDDWEKALPKAAVIVNGSFFGPGRTPDTPFISGGRNLGPQTYDAKAGVFVAGGDGARIVDLTAGGDWQTAAIGADNAMVAYPLLIGSDRQSHVTVKSRWLANRTFVAQDSAGRIVIGSTREAFFSLEREADFLRVAMPDLVLALNLDGGPVACQSVRLGGVHRLHIARWEAQVRGDKVNLLNLPIGESDMPIVLAVTPK